MEHSFIQWLSQQFPARTGTVGIGDDAAVLATDSRTVVTCDTLMDGVDFLSADCDPRQIGHKALAVNLSDLAAMGARPLAALVSLVLPRRGEELARQLLQGMRPLLEQFDLQLIGGDTNSWEGPLVITVTALGTPPARPWLRGGAQCGDVILVTGQFGGSILGKHLTFQPRVEEALWLAGRYQVHAATDVSDGLSLDLSHITEASGCGAALKLAAIPIADAARELAERSPDRGTALEHALGDGEDFELIVVAPPEEARRMLLDWNHPTSLTRIGTIVERRGLWCQTDSGLGDGIVVRGYEHR